MILILGSVGLFFLDKLKPSYARDSDKVYAVLILISGLFSLTNWDMGPGLSFQQLLMAGMLTTLLIENVRNRLPRTEPMQSVNNRVPMPRYDDRQPSRRVYRAQLDERQDGREAVLRDRSRAPRMAPAAQSEWRNDYGNYDNGYSNARPRQPYEEYRGPAGRLQPSDNGPMNSGTMNSGRGIPDERYAERRPYADRPNNFNDSIDRGPDRTPDRQNRPMQPEAERFQARYQPRSEERPSVEGYPDRSSERSPERQPNGSDFTGPAERPDNRPSGARDRSLNVRPYSEAPKLDLDKDDNFGDYRADRPNSWPESTPSES
jgi:hypothetical protein